jgi:signal transduction histidine kinase
MNRLVVRLLVAFLAMIAVTGVSVLASLAFLVVLVSRGVPEALLKQVEVALRKAFEAATFSPTAEENYVLLALLFGSVIVATVLALLLARRIATPLEGVSRAATRVALGEWNARAPLHPREARGGSETARLVRNFNRMAENLEALESERKATVAAIAHELRTPLTVLRGRLEAVRDGVLEGTPDEFGVLISQVELLSRLVTDLRTLSLAEAGQLSLERQEVDVAVLLRSVVNSFETRAREKGVRLEVNASHPAPFSVDAERLHQVVANLLENALRHTDEGFVRADLEVGAAAITLCVRDSGQGIPSEALPHLFERFYRAEGSRARVSGGSGLGLAIVRAIVSLHDGTIEASNHSEGGAVFTVTLPREGRTAVVKPPKVRRAKRQRQPMDNDGFIAPGTFTGLLYHALSFPLGLLYFLVLVIGATLGVGLSVLGVGLLILLATLAFASYAANLERWLNDALLGVPVLYTPRVGRGSVFARLASSLRDLMTWRVVVYLLLKMPFALLAGALLLVMSVLSVGLMSAPVIRSVSSRPNLELFDWQIRTIPEAFLAAAIGIAVGWLTMLISNGLAWSWARFARWLLQDDETSAVRRDAPRALEM